jgi:hypothetical protein
MLVQVWFYTNFRKDKNTIDALENLKCMEARLVVQELNWLIKLPSRKFLHKRRQQSGNSCNRWRF